MKHKNRLGGVLVCLALGLVGSSVAAENQDLLQVYDLALQSDPTLRAALADRNSVRESEPQAKALLLPNLALSADANRVHTDTNKSPTGFTGINNFNDSSLGVGVVQPVYNRSRWIQLDQTKDLITSADAQYEQAQQQLIVDTATAYFNVLRAEDNLRFATANLEATERQLDQAKQRFEVGLIAITDVYEAQASYDGARSVQISAKNAVDTAWEALLKIIGQNHRKELRRLQEEIALNLPEPASVDEWSRTAQTQNLGIVAALSDNEVARKNIEVQRSGHYPTVDLVGRLAYDDSSGSRGQEVTTGLIGLQLNLPLYQGGGVDSSVRQAQYDFQSAQENLDALRRSVNQAVNDAYRGVETAIAQVEALNATVISSKSALEATEAGYEVGTRTIIDVLNVQRNLYENESRYASSRYDYILSGLRLKLAASVVSEDDLKRINEWLE